MSWKLRNTRSCPSRYTEHSYAEVVEVTNGECTVTKPETRDFLLKQSYVLIEEKARDARESPPEGEEAVEEPHANNCSSNDDHANRSIS